MQFSEVRVRPAQGVQAPGGWGEPSEGIQLVFVAALVCAAALCATLAFFLGTFTDVAAGFAFLAAAAGAAIMPRATSEAIRCFILLLHHQRGRCPAATAG